MLREIFKALLVSETAFAVKNLLRKAIDRNDSEWVVEIIRDNLRLEVGKLEELHIFQLIQDGRIKILLDAADILEGAKPFKKLEGVSSRDFSGKSRGSNEDSL